MISSLRGILIHRKNNEIILDVHGVGYHIFVSKKLLESLTDLNKEFTIITHLDVKETSLILYGFSDEREREMFKLLVSVNGIGPKLAHNILTSASFEDIMAMISGSHAIKIPGLGSKKVELISMTLKDKIFKLSAGVHEGLAPAATSKEQARLDALNALMNLGYIRVEAEKIIREVLRSNEDTELTTEEIIKRSLGIL